MLHQISCDPGVLPVCAGYMYENVQPEDEVQTPRFIDAIPKPPGGWCRPTTYSVANPYLQETPTVDMTDLWEEPVMTPAGQLRTAEEETTFVRQFRSPTPSKAPAVPPPPTRREFKVVDRSPGTSSDLVVDHRSFKSLEKSAVAKSDRDIFGERRTFKSVERRVSCGDRDNVITLDQLSFKDPKKIVKKSAPAPKREARALWRSVIRTAQLTTSAYNKFAKKKALTIQEKNAEKQRILNLTNGFIPKAIAGTPMIYYDEELNQLIDGKFILDSAVSSFRLVPDDGNEDEFVFVDIAEVVKITKNPQADLMRSLPSELRPVALLISYHAAEEDNAGDGKVFLLFEDLEQRDTVFTVLQVLKIAVSKMCRAASPKTSQKSARL